MTLQNITTPRAFGKPLPRLRVVAKEEAPAPHTFSQAEAWPAESLARFAAVQAAYERVAALYARPWATRAIIERADTAQFDLVHAATKLWSGK